MNPHGDQDHKSFMESRRDLQDNIIKFKTKEQYDPKTRATFLQAVLEEEVEFAGRLPASQPTFSTIISAS